MSGIPVHNHDLDPTCREHERDGLLLGECQRGLTYPSGWTEHQVPSGRAPSLGETVLYRTNAQDVLSMGDKAHADRASVVLPHAGALVPGIVVLVRGPNPNKPTVTVNIRLFLNGLMDWLVIGAVQGGVPGTWQHRHQGD